MASKTCTGVRHHMSVHKYSVLPIMAQDGVTRVEIPWMKRWKGFHQYAKGKSDLDSFLKVIDIAAE